MAILTLAQIFDVWARLMRNISDLRLETSLTKTDLRAAVEAADVWVDANAASYNSALPIAARTALTAKQKAELLMMVVAKRFEVI